jgi:hypothetical protein
MNESWTIAKGFVDKCVQSGTEVASAIQELFRVIEVHAVGYGCAGVVQGCLLVGDAGLPCLSIERQDGVVFYEGYEPLRLPGAPDYGQQHDCCENLHLDGPKAVE